MNTTSAAPRRTLLAIIRDLFADDLFPKSPQAPERSDGLPKSEDEVTALENFNYRLGYYRGHYRGFWDGVTLGMVTVVVLGLIVAFTVVLVNRDTSGTESRALPAREASP